MLLPSAHPRMVQASGGQQATLEVLAGWASTKQMQLGTAHVNSWVEEEPC